MADHAFTVDDLVKTQRLMRGALGKGEERFPLSAFVGMVSDEIEALRGAGRSDEAIAAMVSEATGAIVTADDLARFYATPDQRHPPGDAEA